MAYYQLVEPGDIQFASPSTESSSAITNRVVGRQHHICRRFEPEAQSPLLLGAALGGNNYPGSQRLEPGVYLINQMNRCLRRF